MLSYITPAAISYLLGVYLCNIFPSLSTAEIIAVALIISLTLLVFLRRKKKYIILCSLFLLFGILSYTNAINIKNNSFYELTGKYVTLEGYVCDIPTKNDNIYSYKMKVTSAEYLQKHYPQEQVIKLSSDISLSYGDNIRVRGFLEEFSEKNNHSDFNTKRYYMSRGIFYRMYARELSMTAPTKTNYSLSYYLNLYKDKLSHLIDKNFSADSAAILKAVACGNKQQFSLEFKKFLLDNGVMKFLYPSFLHIQLISLLTGILFGGLKKKHRDILFIIFMIIYASVNTYSPVFLKNSVMLILGTLFLKKFGFSHFPDILSLTALILGITNPLYCFDASFVMSLTSGVLFYYYGDILENLLYFIPLNPLRRTISSYIISTFLLLPVTVYYFGGINLYINLLSPLYACATLILIILIFLMSIFTYLFGGFTIINSMISGMLWYFTSLPELISRLPFSRIIISPPKIIFIIAFFLTLYLIYLAFLKDIKKPRNIILFFASLGLWCGIIINNFLSLGNLDITFVNVGQGDAAIASISGGETILIDGGGKNEPQTFDAGEEIFLPYLIDNGYTKIDKAIISHCHSDHCMGIIASIKALPVKEIVMPKTKEKNDYQKEIENLAQEKNIPITYVGAGDTLDFPSGMTISVYSPSDIEIQNGDENENSIVMSLKYNGFSCLFTGDIGTETEKRILDIIEDTDVVKMAHHGSKNSNSKEFAEAIHAEYAIISVGEDNMYGFPKEEAINNYQKSGTKIARTDVNGDITIRVFDSGKYKIFKNSI